jgi:hypothetical protein
MACSTMPPAVSDPKAVVDAFLAARTSGQEDAALALVDDDVTVRLVHFRMRPAGKEQMRHYLETPGLSFQGIRAPEADGERVSWFERVGFLNDVNSTDTDPTSVHWYKLGVETVVHNGKITSFIENDMTLHCPLNC